MDILMTWFFLTVSLSATYGLTNPSRKTWWSKRVASDSFHASGRLTERQIKYAAEAGFHTIVSLDTYDSHVGNVSAVGGSYLPSTSQSRTIARDLAGVDFETVLESGDIEWKRHATVRKLHTIIRNSIKPLLLFSNDSYAAAFLLLAHYSNVTSSTDNESGEPSASAYDVFRIGAEMGFAFGKDEVLMALVANLTDSPTLANYPEPDTSSGDWYTHYWMMKPVYKNVFISGQMQYDHLTSIYSAGVEVIVNSRKGVTSPPDNTASQEEVTLLNIRDVTGTYTGSGRQSTQQLVTSRLDPSKPNRYISQTSTVNYESRNSLEFGDDIGYNETLERRKIVQTLLAVEYIHLPVGGQYRYGEVDRDTLKAMEEKGPVLFQCTTGFRSGIIGTLAAAYINCFNSTWAMTRGTEIGYDFSLDPAVLPMFQLALDGVHNCTSAGQQPTSKAPILSKPAGLSVTVLLVVLGISHRL